ncbi:hypothetical protein U6G28_01880 [Actinomycetaceae bacterium MB13-C1-2]|nr:hypothetical protein U6G28_01880 [Actinomycetaceae bacterium MB13-C1-2]
MGEIQKGTGMTFTEVLATAARLPGVRVDREAYLSSVLRSHCTEEQVAAAVATNPARAGVSTAVVDRIATDSIRFEAGKATALSAAAGLPGALAMVATIPADMAQYLGHMLRISQKLAYIFGWPELFNDEDEPDDGTQSILTLFLGVMAGVQVANAAVGQLSVMIAEQLARTLPRKALTKGLVYPAVKAVAKILGVKMTKQLFARWVSKAVPVVGAAVSGGVTFATFVPMSNRLKTHLGGLELARSEGEQGLVQERSSEAV